jgi:shikimate kinase/3-dehydroquinate synthase
LARHLGRPFVDLDEEVARMTGRPPASLIRSDGEPGFRACERAALDRVLERPGAILATGGGTVLDPLNRWHLAAYGTRVRLDVPVERLADRIRRDDAARPLLGGDLRTSLERALAERAPVYAAVDLAVDGDAEPETVARRIADGVSARAGDRTTPGWRVLFDGTVARHHPVGPPHARVALGSDLDGAALRNVIGALSDRPAAVVADGRALAALPLLDAALPTERRLTISGGERVKRFRSLERVLDWLSEEGVERADPLVAVGGGTIGDLAGLAAALHRRGVPLVQVPTTWLAQADSAFGGKAAIDLARAKNAVGAFWPPWLVVSDVSLLAALPRARRLDGMAECVKAALIGDPVLWELIERRGRTALEGSDPAARYAITERAARLKMAVVERDPWEQGERRQLNLGHTIGHALEVASGYRLRHGLAVALGLRAVAGIAAGRGADPALPDRIDALIAGLGFALRYRFDPGSVRVALRGDKKRDRGTQRWLLPMAIGRVEEVGDVSDAEIGGAIARISAPS